jgi:KUP system potassium uptake protein
VTIYVDDYAHAYNQQWLKERLENTFNSLWGISGVGPITYHLGLQVDYKKGEYVRISQKAYFEKLMKRFSFDRLGASLKTDGELKGTVDTPLDPERILFDDCPAVIDEDIKAEYLAIYGSILYGTVHTRPDTAKAMTILGRYMHSPSATHLAALKRVMRYVSKTVDYGLEYNKKDWFLPNSTSPISPFSLINMTDSDWAGDKDKRLSTTGTVTFLCGAPISWRSATQKLQALSSAEAEYIAACEGAKDVLYSRGILKSVDFHPRIEATPMYIDNSAAIAIMSNSGINSRTKHIDLRHHFVRELVSRGDVAPIKVASADNVSDVLTKAVDKATFQRLTPYLIRKVHH